MTDLNDISDLPRDEWIETIKTVGTRAGSFEQLGPDHCASFLDGTERLLVTFETYESITERSDNGMPLGYNIAREHGWSHLGLIAHGATPTAPWFRVPQAFSYFDRLVDDGFFEDFDRVVFYGAGSAGYAASAFSVAAPGSTVIAIAPQATLDGRLASWDGRFSSTRRMDFTTRYGFAPDMIEAAAKVVVLYDPKITHDATHAALFKRAHTTLRPCRHFGPDPEFEMVEMDALTPILEHAMADTLTDRALSAALRQRRLHHGYQRRLLNELSGRNRPMQVALLCSYALRNGGGWKFRRALKNAKEKLREQGRDISTFALTDD